MSNTVSNAQSSAARAPGRAHRIVGARAWSPQLNLRGAHFDGDDLATARDQRFHEMAYGMAD
jgi:hypothetical protein